MIMSYNGYIGIDIGSTFTKGALFILKESGDLELAERFELPTQRDDISCSCISIYERLRRQCRTDEPSVGFSSSAHGGLSMVSIGLVPSFTERIAREAALSAGAKLIGSFSYRLGRRELEEITDMRPDIILFTGGTDGGNRSYVRENAGMLSKLKIPTVVIYAGNRDILDDVRAEFSSAAPDLQTVYCGNVLPEIDNPQLSEVRKRIKEVFMQRIIYGKGLDRASRTLQVKPVPTPGSMFDLVEALSRAPSAGDVPDWCLLDIGGATTDCYSVIREPVRTHYDQIPVFHTGLPEQSISRSVEGDLGMRLNAGTVVDRFEEICRTGGLEIGKERLDRYRSYAERVSKDISRIPEDETEREMEQGLAAVCLSLALHRHAGVLRPVYTADGMQYQQYGKDLSEVRTAVLSGGVSRCLKESGESSLMAIHGSRGQVPLVPRSLRTLYDRDYLLPLLALLNGVDPEILNRYIWQTCLTERA